MKAIVDIRPRTEIAGLAFTADQIELVKRTVCAGTSNDEFQMFLYQCRRTGLDPLARQIYAVKKAAKQEEANAQVQSPSVPGANHD